MAVRPPTPSGILRPHAAVHRENGAIQLDLRFVSGGFGLSLFTEMFNMFQKCQCASSVITIHHDSSTYIVIVRDSPIKYTCGCVYIYVVYIH